MAGLWLEAMDISLQASEASPSSTALLQPLWMVNRHWTPWRLPPGVRQSWLKPFISSVSREETKDQREVSAYRMLSPAGALHGHLSSGR